jgi:unsaturated rhamnogalacturonyl hydrolase
MQNCTTGARQPRVHCRTVLALAALFALLICSAANAQQKKAPLAAPGDTLTTAGPLAQNLSPKLDKRDLAKAMKLVADWQLSRMPADTQFDWTWAALYDGFIAVPKKVGGDKYR